MASSRKIKGYVPEAEVEQIVRSAIRQTARAAAKQPQPVPPHHDEEKLKRILKESINEAFSSLGFDMSDPQKTQKNVAFMNSLAEFTRAGKAKMAMTTVGFITIAALAMILSALGLPAKVMGVLGLSAGSQLGD